MDASGQSRSLTLAGLVGRSFDAATTLTMAHSLSDYPSYSDWDEEVGPVRTRQKRRERGGRRGGRGKRSLTWLEREPHLCLLAKEESAGAEQCADFPPLPLPFRRRHPDLRASFR